MGWILPQRRRRFCSFSNPNAILPKFFTHKNFQFTDYHGKTFGIYEIDTGNLVKITLTAIVGNVPFYIIYKKSDSTIYLAKWGYAHYHDCHISKALNNFNSLNGTKFHASLSYYVSPGDFPYSGYDDSLVIKGASESKMFDLSMSGWTNLTVNVVGDYFYSGLRNDYRKGNFFMVPMNEKEIRYFAKSDDGFLVYYYWATFNK